MTKQHAELMAAMVEYDRGDPLRIQHLVKVYTFCTLIGLQEGLAPQTLNTLQTAAIVHDIGIHLSEKKYGRNTGKYQEIEGPAEAEKLLRHMGGYTEEEIARVCFLVAHHHTFNAVDGIDYQILLEADFLVNAFEKSMPRESVETFEHRVFKTETGKKLLEQTFLSERAE